MDKSNIKVFKLNNYDWVAAENMEEAIEWYDKITGSETQPDDNPHEVPLTDLTYVDSNHNEQQTYASVINLERTTFPCIIATTEN